MTFEWIRFGVAAALIVCGLFAFFTALLGVYKFRFALNRMQSASVGDTMGMFMISLALLVIFGFDTASLKVLLMSVFMWLGGPISTHLISKLEVETDPTVSQHLTVVDFRIKGREK